MKAKRTEVITNESSSKLVTGMLEVAAHIMPIFFDSNKVKVLLYILEASKEKGMTNYNAIGRGTGITGGGELTNTLNSLQSDGLLFNNKNNGSSFYGLTSMGITVADFALNIWEYLSKNPKYAKQIDAGLKDKGLNLKKVSIKLRDIKKSLKK